MRTIADHFLYHFVVLKVKNIAFQLKFCTNLYFIEMQTLTWGNKTPFRVPQFNSNIFHFTNSNNHTSQSSALKTPKNERQMALTKSNQQQWPNTQNQFYNIIYLPIVSNSNMAPLLKAKVRQLLIKLLNWKELFSNFAPNSSQLVCCCCPSVL